MPSSCDGDLPHQVLWRFELNNGNINALRDVWDLGDESCRESEAEDSEAYVARKLFWRFESSRAILRMRFAIVISILSFTRKAKGWNNV